MKIECTPENGKPDIQFILAVKVTAFLENTKIG